MLYNEQKINSVVDSIMPVINEEITKAIRRNKNYCVVMRYNGDRVAKASFGVIAEQIMMRLRKLGYEAFKRETRLFGKHIFTEVCVILKS